MKLAITFATIILAAIAFAADEPKPVPKAVATAVPTISAELRANFWRKQAESSAANNAAQKAKDAADAAVAEMRKACGTSSLELDATTGEPVCKAADTPAPKVKP
jgi:hypothetical protein